MRYDRALMRATRLVLALLVAVACGVASCGGTGGDTRTQVVPEGSKKTRKEAVRQARGVIEEIYESIRRGDVDGLSAIVAPELVVVGPDSGSGTHERADALVALGEALGSGKHAVESKELLIGASPAGASAWAVDRVVVDGKTMHFVALLTGADDLWSVTMVHLARPISSREADQAAGGLAGPRGVAIAKGSEAVAKLFQPLTAAPELILEQLGEDDDSVLVPGTSRSLTVGRKAIRKLWKKVMKAAPAWTLLGGVASGLSSDGSLGWAWAHVDVAIDGPPLTHRVFAIYKQSGGTWDLVVVHPAVLAR